MKMFSKKRDEENYVRNVTDMAKEVVEMYSETIGVRFENTTELERQIIAVYVFGMADGVRQNSEVEIPHVKIISTFVVALNIVFEYSIEQAQTFAYNITKSLQERDDSDTYVAIVHRGLDGYLLWQQNKKREVINDILAIVNVLKR